MTNHRTSVYVNASDPVSEAGVASQVRASGDLLLVDSPDDAHVAVVASDEVDESAVNAIRSLARAGLERILLVATRLDDAGILAAAEGGACGVLRRSEATTDRLSQAVAATAAGNGTIPPDLLGRLLKQVGRLQRDVLNPRGLGPHGLTEREVSVLRLVADGHDTANIANALAYSERTVKNVIHDVVTRLNLRNRCHAVAYAVREGII